MLEILKQQTSPKSFVYWLRITATALPIITVLALASAYALDQRYVTEADLVQGFKQVRILELEDKIFELQQKPPTELTHRERARLARYLRQYEKLTQQVK